MSNLPSRRANQQALVAKKDLLHKFYMLLYKAMGTDIDPGMAKQTFDALHAWHVEAEIEIIKDGTLYEVVNTLTRPDVPEKDRDKLWQFYVRVFTPMMHHYQTLKKETFLKGFEDVKKEAQRIKRKNQIALTDHSGTDSGLSRALNRLRALPYPQPQAPQSPTRRMTEDELKDQNVLDVTPISSFFRQVAAKYPQPLQRNKNYA